MFSLFKKRFYPLPTPFYYTLPHLLQSPFYFLFNINVFLQKQEHTLCYFCNFYVLYICYFLHTNFKTQIRGNLRLEHCYNVLDFKIYTPFIIYPTVLDKTLKLPNHFIRLLRSMIGWRVLDFCQQISSTVLNKIPIVAYKDILSIING